MDILHETRDLIVCLKPPGIASQQDATGENMLSALQAHTGGVVYPVHRLDKPAGGVMVYAKTDRAAAFLSRAIQDGKFHKEYLAALRGVPEAPAGRLEDLLYHDVRRNKTYVVDRQRKGVREAALEYETVCQTDGLTLVRVRLLTGRTHQIRVQFGSRQLPLCGDGIYGGGAGPLGLWSARLRFPSPTGGADLDFSRDPPDGPPWNCF